MIFELTRIQTRFLPLVVGMLTAFLVPVAGNAVGQGLLRVESVVLRPLHAAEVPAQQTGLLQQMVVDEGQQVEKGQLLASLDDREAKLAMVKAELEHAQAEAKANNRVRIQYADKALEVARAELDRSSESIQQFAKSISQSQLDVERLTVEKLLLERQQAEHELALDRYGLELKQNELEAAQLRLEQHQLRAPFAGKVVLVRGRVGEWVEVGAPVLRLVAVDKLRAEGFLSVKLVNDQLVGSQVRFVAAEGEAASHEVVGKLRFVSPEMDPITRQVRVWAELNNSQGRLRPGQQGWLEIVPYDGQKKRKPANHANVRE